MSRLRTLGADGEVDRSKKGLHIESLAGSVNEPVSLGDRGDDRRPSPRCLRERSVLCTGSQKCARPGRTGTGSVPVGTYYYGRPGHC